MDKELRTIGIISLVPSLAVMYAILWSFGVAPHQIIAAWLEPLPPKQLAAQGELAQREKLRAKLFAKYVLAEKESINACRESENIKTYWLAKRQGYTSEMAIASATLCEEKKNQGARIFAELVQYMDPMEIEASLLDKGIQTK